MMAPSSGPAVRPARRVARRVTLEEWLAIPGDHRVELIDGQLVDRGKPGPQHGRAQGKAFALGDDDAGEEVEQG